MGRGRREVVAVGAGARTYACVWARPLLPREGQRLERLYKSVGTLFVFFVLLASEHGGQRLRWGTVSISRERTQWDDKERGLRTKRGDKGDRRYGGLLRTSLGESEKHSFAIASRRRLPRAESESFLPQMWGSRDGGEVSIYRKRRRVQASTATKRTTSNVYQF